MTSHTPEKTGRARVIATLFGPRVEMEYVQHVEDHFRSSSTTRRVTWQRATNNDILQLETLPDFLTGGDARIVATFWGPRVEVCFLNQHDVSIWTSATNDDVVRRKISRLVAQSA